MAEEQIGTRMAEQIGLVVVRARERLADWVEEYMKSKKVDVGFVSNMDKFNIERLFSEAVNTYVIAEVVAILSYVLYDELKNDEILKRIVPAFLDVYEGKVERIPDSLANKTRDLAEIAQRIIDSKTEKSDTVNHLLRDIAGMARVRNLRASYDAALLNFMGE